MRKYNQRVTLRMKVLWNLTVILFGLPAVTPSNVFLLWDNSLVLRVNKYCCFGFLPFFALINVVVDSGDSLDGP